MQIEAYPPQEPVPDGLKFVHETLMMLGKGIAGEEYVYGDHPSQSLVVYPSGQTGGPVLLFMHGGGWTNGYKEEMAFLAPPFNKAGITLVSSSYRLAPDHVFPANFEDVAKAVALVWKLAAKYGYDRDALFVGGHSAGGHLASLLATRTDWQSPLGLPGDVIKGCLPISATYDFTPGSGASVRPRFLGAADMLAEVHASPLFHVGNDAPPFLIAYGADDFPHMKVQGEQFAMVARAKGVGVGLLEVPGVSHITVLLSAAEPDRPWLPAAIDWIRGVTG